MSSIDTATNAAAQIYNANQLRVAARPQPVEEDCTDCVGKTTVQDTADKVTIKDNLFRAADLNVEAEADEQAQPEERTTTTNLEYQRREATVLRLRTQEGDVVKLKLRNVQTASVEVGQQVDGETVVSNLDLNASNRSRLLISVRGDINDAELAAIQGVAEQAAQLAGSFFSGNLNAAFQAASEFAIDGSQLAKVSLRLSVRERLNFAQSVVTNTPALPPAASEAVDEATRPASQAATVVPKVVSGSANPAIARADVPVPAAPVTPPTTTTPTAATDDTTEPVPADEPTQPANLLDAFQALADFLNSIASFIDNLLSSFTPQGETEGDAAPAADTNSSAFNFRFKMELFAAVISTGLDQPEAADEAAEGGQLLSDTLAAVTQEVDPQTVSEVA